MPDWSASTRQAKAPLPGRAFLWSYSLPKNGQRTPRQYAVLVQRRTSVHALVVVLALAETIRHAEAVVPVSTERSSDVRARRGAGNSPQAARKGGKPGPQARPTVLCPEFGFRAVRHALVRPRRDAPGTLPRAHRAQLANGRRYELCY